MNTQARPIVKAAAAARLESLGDAKRISDEIVATWQRIHASVAPIVGSRGVAALYYRSLHLAVRDHPWLTQVRSDKRDEVDLVSLKSVLANESRSNAAAGGTALISTFTELLTSLVGSSLTDRLLKSVWEIPSVAEPRQEPSP